MARPFEWPSGKPFSPPSSVEMAGADWTQPPRKPPPSPSTSLSQIGPHMAGIRTDEEYDGFVKGSGSKGRTVSTMQPCIRLRLRFRLSAMQIDRSTIHGAAMHARHR